MKIFLILVFFLGMSNANEKKVAIVDNHEITYSDIYRKMSVNHFSKTLDDLISEKLLINYAQKNNIKVDKTEIVDMMNKIKSGFDSESQFKKELSKMGLNEKDYQRIIENELLSIKAIDVILNINVTDEDAKKYYDSNPEQFKTPQSAKLRQIFVNTEQEANDVYLALEAGANFEKMSLLKSADENLKKAAGDIGYISKGMLIPEIEKEVFALEPGKYTKPIKTGTGYSIIKMEDRRNERVVPFDEIKERIKESIRWEIVNRNRNNVINMLKEKAKITIF